MSNDRFSGDPKLILTENGADMVYRGGQPEMDQGFENQAMISLFTRPGWCGNIFFSEAERIGSDFEETASRSRTLSGLADVANSAERALSDSAFGTVEATVTNPVADDLVVVAKIGASSGFLLSKYGPNWKAQALNPASARVANAS